MRVAVNALQGILGQYGGNLLFNLAHTSFGKAQVTAVMAVRRSRTCHVKLLQYRTRRFGYLFQLVSQHGKALFVFRRVRQLVGVDEERQLYLVRCISFLYLRPFLVQQRIHLLREEVVLQELHRAFGLARIDLVRSGVRCAVIFQVHDGKATVVPVGVGHDDGIRPVQVHGPCSQRLRFDVRTQRITVHVIAHFAFLRQGIFLAVVYGRACKGYRIVRFAVQYVRLYNQSREAVAEVRRQFEGIVRNQHVSDHLRRFRFRFQNQPHGGYGHTLQHHSLVDAHIYFHLMSHFLQYRGRESHFENQRTVVRNQYLIIPVLVGGRFPFLIQQQCFLLVVAVQYLLHILAHGYGLGGIHIHRYVRERHFPVFGNVIYGTRYLHHFLRQGSAGTASRHNQKQDPYFQSFSNHSPYYLKM